METEPDFTTILRDGLRELGMSPERFADQYRLSKTCVRRWLTGKNLPVRALRGMIVRELNELLANKRSCQ